MELDQRQAEEAVERLLEAMGEDPGREGLKETPRRVAEMYREIFAGMHEDPEAVLAVTFEAGHNEMVMVRDIPLYSLCEHHLVPFVGKAHVAYIPGAEGRITGLSKLARLVQVFARRPQVQERLTTQVADTMEKVLKPKGVFVVMEAEHLCMTMRGARAPGSITVTSAVRGVFKTDARTRAEAMSHLHAAR